MLYIAFVCIFLLIFLFTYNKNHLSKKKKYKCAIFIYYLYYIFLYMFCCNITAIGLYELKLFTYMICLINNYNTNQETFYSWG